MNQRSIDQRQRTRIAAAVVFLLACLVFLWWWNREADPAATPASAGVPTTVVEASEPLVGDTATTEREAASLTDAAPVAETLPPLNLRDPHMVVQVLDKADQPIAGALVETFWDTEPAKLTTDAEGRCELPFPATRMKLCRVRVVASGYRHLEATFWRNPVLPIRLASLSPLRGRVLDADTKAPVMGAVIELVEPCTCTPPERTTSAGDGTFTLTEAPEDGQMSIRVEAEGYPRDAFTFTRQDASREEEFLIGRGVEIEGSVVDFTTGAPVPGARITDRDRGGSTLVTDAAGRFAGRALTSRGASTLNLRVEADGWCTLIGLRVTSSDSSAIRLPRTAFFEGTIIDTGGRPAAGVELTFQVDWAFLNRTRAADSTAEIPLDELGPKWSVESPATAREPGTLQPPPAAKSDERGHYRTKGVQPFATYLKISSPHRAEGWIETKAPPSGPPGETVRLDLTLQRLPFGTIVGRVTVNGSPRQALVKWKGATRAGELFTHADGSYGLDYVEAGAVTLTVHPEGFAQPPTGSEPTGFEESVDIVLADGETERHDFELDVPLGKISGHVRYESGRAAPGLWVTLRTPFDTVSPRIHMRVQSDDEGRWFADVPERVERYSAQMSTAAHELIQDDLMVGASNVDFVLPENGRLLVRGIDAVTKRPVERLDISWRRPGQSGFGELWMPLLPDGQGWYSLPLPTGAAELLVDGGVSGYLPREVRDVHVGKAKADERVEVELEPGLDLELRLSGGSAPWPTTHAVALIEASESVECGQYEGTPTMRIERRPGSSSRASRQIVLGGTGTAQLRGLLAGRYHLSSCPPGLTFEPAEIELSPTSAKTVEVRWH